MQGCSTYGLHVDALQLGAFGLGILHPHVARNALGTRCIIDGDEALPLLDRAGHLPGDVQPLLLHLGLKQRADRQECPRLSWHFMR